MFWPAWDHLLSVPDLERLRDLLGFVTSEIGRSVPAQAISDYIRRHPAWRTRLRAWRRALWLAAGPRREPKTGRAAKGGAT
jgi:hypothetical protein